MLRKGYSYLILVISDADIVYLGNYSAIYKDLRFPTKFLGM